MKRSHIVVFSLTVLLVICIIMQFTGPRKYNWNINETPTLSGEEPYDRMLFDEMLHRSMHNGYEVKMLDTLEIPDAYYQNYSPSHSQIRLADIDTALLVIKNYDWEKVNNDIDDDEEATFIFIDEDGATYSNSYHYDNKYYSYEIDVTYDLLYFASRGGQAVYVNWYNVDAPPTRLIEHFFNHNELARGNNVYVGPVATSLDAIKNKKSNPIETITAENDTLTLNSRFIYEPFYIPNDNFSEFHNWYHYQEVVVRPMLLQTDHSRSAHGIEFYFPDTGGHLYLTGLGMYFCNLGLQIPDGDKVISYFMGKIDDRPVARLDYPDNVYRHNHKSQSRPLLNKIVESRALYLCWILMLIMAALLLSRGIMRRYPAAKGVMADDLDKTDHIAVREHHLRHSPLLHFLFQTSWLYDGNKDYSSLFAINYRRLCRTVNKYTGVELKTASDSEIRVAGRLLARNLGIDEKEAREDLKWMKEWADFSPISPRQFAKSQKIVEKYPF